MVETLLAHFPELNETAAAAIVYAFNQWWATALDIDPDNFDEERLAVIHFAAGWLRRPADYT